MKTILVDDFYRPRHLGRPEIYRYPLPRTLVLVSDTTSMKPAYESSPIRIGTEPALLVVCKSATDVPAGAVRLILSRKNTEFLPAPMLPAFKYENGLDVIEAAPARVSTDGGGYVFAFGTTAFVDEVRVRIFHPIEHFAVYLLTEKETARFNVLRTNIYSPFQQTEDTDPVLIDDFERGS
jgi:hypothetical protein